MTISTRTVPSITDDTASAPMRLALDLASLDVGSIAAISGGDEIASLTSGHAVADLAATCCCGTSSCCTCGT